MSTGKKVGNYLMVLCGAFILAFGLYNIHSQTNVTEGGVLGLSLLVQYHFHISPAITQFVLDFICYIIALKFLGSGFAKYALVATVVFALAYGALERFPPMLPNLAAMPLLAALVGGLFVGVGAGLVVRVGGACGGDDALALSISKAAKWPISRAYLFTDLVVLAASLTYIPVGKIIYSLVTVTVSSCVIGFVQKAGKKG